MLSPVFWLSLVAVFLGMRWLAEGLLSLARVELRLPVEGRRRFRGRLMGVEQDRIRLETDQEEVELSFDDIQKAKLVLTDDLIAASQDRPHMT